MKIRDRERKLEIANLAPAASYVEKMGETKT